MAALDKKREARRQCKTKHTTATWKALRATCKEVRAAIDKGIEVHLEEYLAELETLLRHRDMRGLYKHLKMTVDLGGRKTEGQRTIKDENGNLLRDKGNILRRWGRFFGNLLNTKSPVLQPSIVEKVQQRRKAAPPPSPPPGARSQIGEPISLEAEPTYAETQKAVRAMVKWKVPGADSLPVELLKLDDSNWTTPPANPSSSSISTPFSSVCGEGRKSHRNGKTQRSRCSTRSRTDPTGTTSEGFHSSPTRAKYC